MPASLHHAGIAELLEPAIDGPPSPESIRALSNQMRRASAMDKHQSGRTTSSGSSSLRSQTSADRPSWDHAFDNAAPALSRQSSGRSASSSAPSRERYDSVQLFGRTIFSKRTKGGRRESSSRSSNMSLYAPDLSDKRAGMYSPPATSYGPPPSTASSSVSAAVSPSSFNTSPSSKDAFIPSFFNRRRSTKSGSDELECQRRPLISGPYNFKHLTHTQKEHIPSLHGGNRTALQSDFTAVRVSQQPTAGALRGIHAQSIYFDSCDQAQVQASAAASAGLRPLPLRQHSASVSSTTPLPHMLLHTLSDDQLRIPPPRPPRSPIEASSFSPPVPPPRMSSRASIRYGEFDALATTTVQRPRTSGGFRMPAPLSLTPDAPEVPLPRLSHAHSFSADLFANTDSRRYSQLITSLPSVPSLPSLPSMSSMPSLPSLPAEPLEGISPTNMTANVNWPLASPPPPPMPALTTSLSSTSVSTAVDILPGVPEEEEQTSVSRNSLRKSRMSTISIVSTSSSLRACQSLPMLRRASHAQAQPASPRSPRRPPSGASDTLGFFDVMAAQRTLRQSLQDDDGVSYMQKDSWEDAIDYCYEHAVEADCEYAWERSSLDLSRDEREETDGSSGSDTENADPETEASGSRETAETRETLETLGPRESLLLPPVGSSPATSDVPVLSPASQTSMASMREATTPTSTFAMRRPSLTIATKASEDDAPSPMRRFLHKRTSSRASSFKESHGFNLSPTFFIPGTDNYEHRVASRVRVGFALGAEEEEDLCFAPYPFAYPYAEPVKTSDSFSLFTPSRISASTAGSRESQDSVLSDRHISATSTATDLTRLTVSTASMEDLMTKPEMEAALAAAESDSVSAPSVASATD